MKEINTDRSHVTQARSNLTRADERTMMPSASSDGGVDHISDHGDDLLLHIPRFLSDNARDVVCTSVLSTRWRDLWTRAPVLRILKHKPGSSDSGDSARFNDFVHNVLARRVYGGADIDRLDLSAWVWPGKSWADVWLRRAMRHTVGSLDFMVATPPVTLKMMMGRETNRRPARVDLPTTTRATKMVLQLDRATLLLPPAVEFYRLTELSLGGIAFSDDDGPRLGHLLSSPSCCPRLRKLTLSGLSGLHDLRLDGGALETLDLSGLDVRRLDVDAPRLALLDAQGFFMKYLDDDHTSLTVRAPALQRLRTSIESGRLGVQYYPIKLMHECRPMHGHTLSLFGPKNLEDDPMAGMPQLPGVKDLTLRFMSKGSHYLGATVASLLARCDNLEYLHMDNDSHNQYENECEEGCDECGLPWSWKDDVLLLEQLREVKLGGFSGQERYCVDMVQLLLASAPALERMTLTAKTSMDFWWEEELMLVESLESSLPHGRGRWTAHPAANAAVTAEYEWTRDLEMHEITQHK